MAVWFIHIPFLGTLKVVKKNKYKSIVIFIVILAVCHMEALDEMRLG